MSVKVEGNPLCPGCNQILDGATCTDPDKPDAVPTVGDITICSQCATIGVFREPNVIEEATEEDLSKIDEASLEQLRMAQRFLTGE